MAPETIQITSKTENDLLREALNLIIEKYEDADYDGSDDRVTLAETLHNRTPSNTRFETDDDGDDDQGPSFVFFDDREDTFTQPTECTFLGTRTSGDIKVSRRMKVDPDTKKLTMKESYFFGDLKAETYMKDLGRVDGVKRHTSWPLASAEIKGRSVEAYAKSLHYGSIERDDNRVSQILAKNPDLRPHIWRECKPSK